VNNFSISKNLEDFYDDIEKILGRLNYPLSKEDCTDVVLDNGKFVGAFNISNSVPLGVVGIRINWLSVTKESEDKKLHVGSYILESVIDISKSNSNEAIYISVNKKNKRAINLYKKFGFYVVKTEGNEQDMKLVL